MRTFKSLLLVFFCCCSTITLSQDVLKWSSDKKKLIYTKMEFYLNPDDTLSIRYTNDNDVKNKKFNSSNVSLATNQYNDMMNKGSSYSYGYDLSAYNPALLIGDKIITFLERNKYLDSLNYSTNDFLNTLVLRPKIKKYIYHNRAGTFGKNLWNEIEVGIEWVICNYYMEPIDSVYIYTHSNRYNGDYTKNSTYDKATFDIVSYDYFKAPFLETAKFQYYKLIEELIKKKTILYDSLISKNEKTIEISLTKDVENLDLSTAISSGVTIKTKLGFGSGIIISSDGYIVSKYHVIANSQSDILVVLNNGKEFIPEIIFSSLMYDLVLLKINDNKLNFLKISQTKDVTLGQDVFAIGTSQEMMFGQSLTKGVVSATRKFAQTDYLQADLSINSGNSGGALVNKKGEIIGIISSKLIGKGIEGIGFATHSKYIFDILGVKYISK